MLIVGDDGSAGAKDAAALAHVLRTATAAALTTVCLEYSAVSPAEGAARAAAELGRMADRTGADAIVIGPTSWEGERLPSRSVGARLLYGAPCAVLVAPRGYAAKHHLLTRVTVAYDGTGEIGALLASTEELAWDIGARLNVVSAVGGEHEGTVDSIVRGIAPELHASGDLVAGDPAAALANLETDLLVVSSSREGPRGHAFLGETTAALLRRARVPVLIVPRWPAGRGMHSIEAGVV